MQHFCETTSYICIICSLVHLISTMYIHFENETIFVNICICKYIYVSGFKKRGHFGRDLNFEILICTEIIGNQLSFTACFTFIAAWIHFLCAFI